MKKEQLEVNIAALELLVSESADKSIDFKAQLEQAKQELADINKPELTPKVFDDMYVKIEEAISEFDWDDTGNYDIEYGIDYDGKVYCESHGFNGSSDIVEEIVKKLSTLFVEVEEKKNEPIIPQPVETQPVIKEITVDGGEEEVTVTPTENEMKEFNNKVEETKEKSFKKRTWFSK